MSTRVFVRLYDGTMQNETGDEVLELPPPPLKWKCAITAMVAALSKQTEYEDGVTTPKARLFLLPTETTGIAAELNARSLRFGVRENDRFVICLRGEDYQQPSERQTDIMFTSTTEISNRPLPGPLKPSNVSSQSTIAHCSSVQSSGDYGMDGARKEPPRGGMGFGISLEKVNRCKRYRSISGKMAAIKSLGDKGLISNVDRGHLKDLLLNDDSPQLQEALDTYKNTGDFQAVKDLLLREINNPSSKRNSGDWLSESFVNEIALNLIPSPQATKREHMPLQKDFNLGRINDVSAALNAPTNAFAYQTSQSASIKDTSYAQSSPDAFNYYSSLRSLEAPAAAGSFLSINRFPTEISILNGYSSSPMMTQQYHQPQFSTSNMYAPQINQPLRDGAYMKRDFESDSAQNLRGMDSLAGSLAGPAHLTLNGYSSQQDFSMNQVPYPANVIYQSQQPLNSLTPASLNDFGCNIYMQQPQYALNRYGYGSMQPDTGYNFYAAGYGFDKAQLRAGPGGKWTTAPPTPSYPPACSKEEKKDKISRWLKKRENRNWSNKPSYPVRHSIAKNRKRGEDGRFITKARLAEMAAEEAAMDVGNEIKPQTASPPPSSSGDAAGFATSQKNMLPITSVP
ncbi:hypothetical protein CCR75_005281 [Bremia lactucae]|uniref:CCT domain-containing protein n=1 Tax=Bremia lactucae TaxID=4779 RepID=A0A976ID10_BRELC|nr:hypothetical protein CCR75_005281 [Bremia lactucae]